MNMMIIHNQIQIIKIYNSNNILVNIYKYYYILYILLINKYFNNEKY